MTLAGEGETYDVVLCGFGETLAEPPAVGLKRVFGIDDAAAGRLLEGLPRTVQRGVPLVRAEYFRRALKLIGAQVEIHGPDGALVPDADPEPEKLEVPSVAAPTSADSLTRRALAPTDRPDARPSRTPERTATRTVAQVPAPVASPEAAAPRADGLRAPAHPTLREGVPAPVASPAGPVGPSPAAATAAAASSATAVAKPTPHSSNQPSVQSAWGSIKPSASRDNRGAIGDTVFDANNTLDVGGTADRDTAVDPARESSEPAAAPRDDATVSPAPAAPGGTPGGGVSLPGRKVGESDSSSILLGAERFTAVDMEAPSAPVGATFHAHEVEHPKPKFDVSERIGAVGKVTAPAVPEPAAPSVPAGSRPAPKHGGAGDGVHKAVGRDGPNAGRAHGWLASLDVEGERNRRAVSSAATRKASVKERANSREAAQTRVRTPRADTAKRAATAAGPIATRAAASSEAASPAARRRIPDLRSFWASIFDGIALPFHGGGPYWIVAITIWTIIVSLIGVLASFAPHFSIGLIVSFFTMTSALAFSCDFFRVCMWVPKLGERAVDGGPGLEPERILHVYFKQGLFLSFFGLLLVLPAIWWAYRMLAPEGFSDPNALFELALHPVTWSLLVLPGVYWPMGVALTALSNSFASIWNVPLVVRGIMRAPAEYFVTASLGHIAFLVCGGGLWVLGSSMGLTGELAQSTLGLPLAVSHGIHGALMGHLIRSRPDVLEE